MASEPYGFFRNGYLIGEHRNLGKYPLLVNLNAEAVEGLADSVEQSLLVFLYGLRRAFLNLFDNAQNSLSAAENVSLKLFALGLAHRDKGIYRLLCRCENVGCNLLLVLGGFMNREHVRKTCERYNGNVVFDSVGLGNFLHRSEITRHELVIDRNLGRSLLALADAYVNVNLTPCNVGIHKAFELVVKKAVAPWSASRKLKVTVVYAFDFNGDFSAVELGFAPAEARH